MSFDALSWAAKQNTGSSGTKLVLLALAECANRTHSLAFPSIAEIVEFSALDRKSVITNLAKLEDAGLIADTGRKVGRTQQIKVYQLNLPTVPKTEQFQKRNSSGNSAKSPKNGTRNLSEPTEAKASYEVIGELWNSLSPSSGIPEIQVWNNSRKQMANARVKEHGLDAILRGVRCIHASPFCRGEQGDGRKQDIGLLLQPKTCARVLEGFYGADEVKPELGPAERIAQLKRMLSIYEAQDRADLAARTRVMIAEMESLDPAAAVVSNVIAITAKGLAA